MAKEKLRPLALAAGLAVAASGLAAPSIEANKYTAPCLEYGSTTRVKKGDLWVGKAEILVVDLAKNSTAIINGEVVTSEKGVTNTLAVVDNPTCAVNYAFPLKGKLTVDTFADSYQPDGVIADQVSIILDANRKATFDVVYADQGIQEQH